MVGKQGQGWFRLDVRENFFAKRGVRRWNRLPRVPWNSCLWRDLEACVDVALGDIVRGGLGSACLGLDSVILEGISTLLVNWK